MDAFPSKIPLHKSDKFSDVLKCQLEIYKWVVDHSSWAFEKIAW